MEAGDVFSRSAIPIWGSRGSFDFGTLIWSISAV
jgi:hypothetical protein